jgi:hypothetical protein
VTSIRTVGTFARADRFVHTPLGTSAAHSLDRPLPLRWAATLVRPRPPHVEVAAVPLAGSSTCFALIALAGRAHEAVGAGIGVGYIALVVVGADGLGDVVLLIGDADLWHVSATGVVEALQLLLPWRGL